MHAYNANQTGYDYSNNELEGEFDAQALRSKPEPLEKLVQLTNFDRRELKLIYRGFKQICPLGVVREDKFKLIYAQFFPRYAETNGYARFVFNSFDVQRKQEITFTDFVVRLSVLTRGTIDDKLKWIFSLYDLNADGVVTRDEFAKILGSIYDLVGRFSAPSSRPPSSSTPTNRMLAGRASNLSSSVVLSSAQSTEEIQQEAEILFKKFDLNQDGMITQDEFIDACKKDPNIMNSISVFNTIL